MENNDIVINTYDHLECPICLNYVLSDEPYYTLTCCKNIIHIKCLYDWYSTTRSRKCFICNQSSSELSSLLSIINIGSRNSDMCNNIINNTNNNNNNNINNNINDIIIVRNNNRRHVFNYICNKIINLIFFCIILYVIILFIHQKSI